MQTGLFSGLPHAPKQVTSGFKQQGYNQGHHVSATATGVWDMMLLWGVCHVMWCVGCGVWSVGSSGVGYERYITNNGV